MISCLKRNTQAYVGRFAKIRFANGGANVRNTRQTGCCKTTPCPFSSHNWWHSLTLTLIVAYKGQPTHIWYLPGHVTGYVVSKSICCIRTLTCLENTNKCVLYKSMGLGGASVVPQLYLRCTNLMVTPTRSIRLLAFPLLITIVFLRAILSLQLSTI